MKDEMRRIMKLVEEGKISANDAMDLIEAIESGSEAEPVGVAVGAASDGVTPPPKTDEAGAKHQDPLRAAMDSIEKLTKDIAAHVDWKEVTEQVRTGAKKGFEAIRDAAKDISEGKVTLGFFFNSESKTVELPLAFEPRKTLRIDNPSGTVTVSGKAPLGKVVAVATIQGASQTDAKERAEQYNLVIEESEMFVEIKQPNMSGLSVNLTVSLSESCPVEIRTASGDIAVIDLDHGVRVYGASGNVKLERIEGVVEISTSSGDIEILSVKSPSLVVENKSGDIELDIVEGNLNVRTASGDVSALHIVARTLAIEAVSGDVNVEVPGAFDGTLSIRTVQGDTRVKVGSESSARVTLATLNGDVSCDLDLAEKHNQDKRITGTIGAGAGTIDISAVSGDVHLN